MLSYITASLAINVNMLKGFLLLIKSLNKIIAKHFKNKFPSKARIFLYRIIGKKRKINIIFLAYNIATCHTISPSNYRLIYLLDFDRKERDLHPFSYEEGLICLRDHE